VTLFKLKPKKFKLEGLNCDFQRKKQDMNTDKLVINWLSLGYRG